DQPGRGSTDGLEGARDGALRVDRAAAAGVLALRHAEEEYGGYAEVGEATAFLGRAVDGALRLAGHGRDLALDALAGDDEERLHQLLADDARLANQPAQGFVPPQPPRAVRREAAHRSSSH